MSGGDPIAASTWLGPTLPDEQAAPALTMTPSRSSAMTWVSAGVPGIAIAEVLGSRGNIGAEHDRLGCRVDDRRFERNAQLADAVIGRHLRRRGLGGGRETGDAGHVLGAGAASPLLSAAAQQRRQIDPAGYDQRADPRRAADLVRRQGQQIGADRGDVERHLAGGLHRVAVKEGALRMRQRRDLRDRLDDAGLVVGEHNRNQRRPRVSREKTGESVEPDDAVAVDRDRLGPRNRLAHRVMLDRGHQQALAPGAEQGQMIGLAAAADENDAFGRRADQSRHRDAAALHHLPPGAAPAVNRGRVAATLPAQR